MEKDSFGDRMKRYEATETDRRFIPQLPIYARLDGRAFHTFTRQIKCARPYDPRMSDAMIETTRRLVEQTHATIGYTQSDEISLCWHLPDPKSEMPFGGKIFKLTSVLAGLCSAASLRHVTQSFGPPHSLPSFDCRVMQFPNTEECANMFLWRERDATKNAISMAAHALYSDKELHGKTSSEKQEMLFQKGVNFNDYPPFFKRGTFLRRVTRLRLLAEQEMTRIPEQHRPTEPVERSTVEVLDMPSFNKVTNRAAVICEGAEPILATEQLAA